MFPLTIAGLRGNLVELYTAAQKGHEIISLPNDTLWDREICIGKFFHWTVSKLNLAPNVLNEVVQTTCLKTHTCFEQVLEKVKQDITLLNRLVITAYQRELISEEYCLQHSILKGMWYWEKRLLCLFRDPKADEILTKIYSELALKGNIAIDTVRSVRKTSLLLKQSKQVRILCRLISQLNYDGGELLQFPFSTLNHCSLGLPLDDKMEKELREWKHRSLIVIFNIYASFYRSKLTFSSPIKEKIYNTQKTNTSLLNTKRL